MNFAKPRSGVVAAAVATMLILAPGTDTKAASHRGPDDHRGEWRLGVVDHDTGVFGRTKESGVDITVELRFKPLRGGVWDALGTPRLHVGANISTAGDTSQFYSGLTWSWYFWGPLFTSFDFGFSIHDGSLSSSKSGAKELGSRILFREALELGVRLTDRHTLAIRLDHSSNANLADHNEGIDNFGLVYGYRF